LSIVAMVRTAGPYALLLAAGALAARAWEPLYAFAWTHPVVMLLGQFALLALGALTARWMLAGFWVFSGATAYALIFRAADALHGGLAAAAAVAVAIVAAAALFARVRSGAHEVL
jgi:hypothetical protein